MFVRSCMIGLPLSLAFPLAGQSTHFEVVRSAPLEGHGKLSVVNRHSIALEAFAVISHCAGRVDYRSYDAKGNYPRQRPILPGASSTGDEFGYSDECPTSVDAVVFEDGSFEGDPEAVRKLLDWRLGESSEAGYWLPKLRANPGTQQSIAELVSEMDARLDLIQKQDQQDAALVDKKEKRLSLMPSARLSLLAVLRRNFQMTLDEVAKAPQLRESEIQWRLAYCEKDLEDRKSVIDNARSQAVMLKMFADR